MHLAEKPLTLTDEQRTDLQQDVEQLREALPIFDKVAGYGVPYTYPKMIQLMHRQIAAIDHLLENGTLGYDMNTLRYGDDQEDYVDDNDTKTETRPFHKRHLANLKFIGESVSGITDASEQETVHNSRLIELHDMNGAMARHQIATIHLEQILSDNLAKSFARKTAREDRQWAI